MSIFDRCHSAGAVLEARTVQLTLVLALFLSGLVVEAHQQPAAAATSWKASKILAIGDAVPDEPGARILEFGAGWFIPPNLSVVWARIAPGDKGWALLSIKGEQVRTVLREGDQASSRYAAEGTEPIKFSRSYTWNAGATLIVAGGGALYISDQRRQGLLQVWDGDTFRPVLKRGEAVAFAGTTFTVAATFLGGGFSSDGSILVEFNSKTPREIRGLGLYKNKQFIPLLLENEPLPGMNSIRIKFPRYGPFTALSGTALYVFIDKVEPPNKPGLYRVSAEGSKQIIAKDDPLPGEPSRKISEAHAIRGGDGSYTVINAGDWRGLRVLLYDGKEVKRFPSFPDGVARTIWPGVFSKDNYIFATTRQVKGGESDEFWALRGDELRLLPMAHKAITVYQHEYSYRRMDPPFSGLIISANLSEKLARDLQKALKLPPERFLAERPIWFLSDEGTNLESLPELDTSLGKIQLDSVLGWMSADKGVAFVAGTVAAIERRSS
jgi:hypothetical protein